MFTNDRKIYTLVGVIIVFFVIVFGIIYFFGPKKDRREAPSIPQPTASIPADTRPSNTEEPATRRPLSEVIGEMMYAPYADPGGRFTFEYPLGWDVVQNPGNGAAVIIRNKIGDQIGETMKTVKADIAVIYEAARPGSPKTCAEFNPSDINVISCQNVIISGVPSLLLDLETQLGIGDEMFHQRQLLVINEKIALVIQTRAYSGVWQQYDQMFMRVLSSFRLLP